jgi:hypothetical protein
MMINNNRHTVANPLMGESARHQGVEWTSLGLSTIHSITTSQCAYNDCTSTRTAYNECYQLNNQAYGAMDRSQFAETSRWAIH